jgi:hypothetical protein
VCNATCVFRQPTSSFPWQDMSVATKDGSGGI